MLQTVISVQGTQTNAFRPRLADKVGRTASLNRSKKSTIWTSVDTLYWKRYRFREKNKRQTFASLAT